MKFVPLTVSVKAASPYVFAIGLMLVVVGTGFAVPTKVAVMLAARLFRAMLQGLAAPVQVFAPCPSVVVAHPTKVEPVAATAVRVTVSLLSKLALHVVPQLIDSAVFVLAFDVTVP